jgi:hypothetical protein
MQHAWESGEETAVATGATALIDKIRRTNLAVRRNMAAIRASVCDADYESNSGAEAGARGSLSPAANFCPPPAHSDEQKTPVMKELRGFAFEGMADELERPSGQKQSERIRPQTVNESASDA